MARFRAMTQEDKQLLLVDLCGRLPYGVVMTNIELPKTHYPLTCEDLHAAMFDDDWNDVPCLRPLSSMTDEEKEELKVTGIIIGISTSGTIETTIQGVDWLNKKMFDYRGLIPKGRAIEAPKEMYKKGE